MKKFLVWLFILVILGLAAAYLGRNALVAKAIEEGGNYSLGVDTHLGSANVAVTAGSLEMNQYKVANPKGFESPDFFSIEHGVLVVNSGSVFSDTVEIDSIVLNDIKVTLEAKGGKTNYGALMENISKVEFGSSEKSPVMLRIKKIGLSNISVDASISLPTGKEFKKSFVLENIEMRDIGNDGASISKVIALVIQEVVKKSVAEGKKILPGDYGNYLDNVGKSGLDQVTSDIKDRVGNLGESLFGGEKKKK